LTKLYGLEIKEDYFGQMTDLLAGIDPGLQKAIVWGLHALQKYFVVNTLNEAFTIIYGTILSAEDALRCTCSHEPLAINIKDYVAKPKYSDKWTNE
jgi:hypothetical protein